MNVFTDYAVSGVFFGASLAMLIIKSSPSFSLLLKYGKTATQRPTDTSLLHSLASFVASFTVPKAFFTQFYVGFCFLLIGPKTGLSKPLINWIRREIGPLEVRSPQNDDKYRIIWCLLIIQSIRRLLECIFITKSSPKARINVLHYIAGFTFYPLVAFNLLIGQLLSNDSQNLIQAIFPRHLSSHNRWLIAVFAVFSSDQLCNHWHLSRLVKYSVPTHGLFKVVSCPHYLDEICIYLVVTTVAFSNGTVTSVDINFAAAWVFVAVNLGLSSLESYAYYKKKFDHYEIRWALIPGVF